MSKAILLQRDAGSPVAIVTLSNPKKRNAIDAAMWRDLKRVMDDLYTDSA